MEIEIYLNKKQRLCSFVDCDIIVTVSRHNFGIKIEPISQNDHKQKVVLQSSQWPPNSLNIKYISA